MILTHLKFLKLFSWTFVFIFEIFLSLSVSQKFLTHKRMKKNWKNSKNRHFHQNSQKSTNVEFFQKYYYRSLILLLKCLWYDFGTHTTIFDDFMKIWKSIFFTKKKQFISKKIILFFKNINYGGPLYRRRNMNTSSI